LHGGLLIDQEHGRVLRRVQIEADDVGGFAFAFAIVAGPRIPLLLVLQ
jgi:hypothetical protein